jgi:sulfur carrier protein
MIHIKVNNVSHQFKKAPSLEEILKNLKLSTNGIALAVNQNIISRNDWSATSINDKDEILIIKATQGG